MRYEIVVSGERISPEVQATFDPLVLSVRDGQTVMTGEFADAPALQSVLKRMEDLGLELVGLRRRTPTATYRHSPVRSQRIAEPDAPSTSVRAEAERRRLRT